MQWWAQPWPWSHKLAKPGCTIIYWQSWEPTGLIVQQEWGGWSCCAICCFGCYCLGCMLVPSFECHSHLVYESSISCGWCTSERSWFPLIFALVDCPWEELPSIPCPHFGITYWIYPYCSFVSFLLVFDLDCSHLFLELVCSIGPFLFWPCCNLVKSWAESLRSVSSLSCPSSVRNVSWSGDFVSYLPLLTTKLYFALVSFMVFHV